MPVSVPVGVCGTALEEVAGSHVLVAEDCPGPVAQQAGKGADKHGLSNALLTHDANVHLGNMVGQHRRDHRRLGRGQCTAADWPQQDALGLRRGSCQVLLRFAEHVLFLKATCERDAPVCEPGFQLTNRRPRQACHLSALRMPASCTSIVAAVLIRASRKRPAPCWRSHFCLCTLAGACAAHEREDGCREAALLTAHRHEAVLHGPFAELAVHDLLDDSALALAEVWHQVRGVHSLQGGQEIRVGKALKEPDSTTHAELGEYGKPQALFLAGGAACTIDELLQGADGRAELLHRGERNRGCCAHQGLKSIGGRRRADGEGSESRAKWWVKRVPAPRQPKRNHYEFRVHRHELLRPRRAPAFTLQLLSALGREEEASIFERHLTILQEIVQQWQHIPLCLFDALQHQDTAMQSCAYWRLVDVLHTTVANLATLLQVCLAGVASDSHVFNLTAEELTKAEDCMSK
mmetsp:Transcript_10524/g.32738  ORF Transcript_10524/g.32738 Transcript_10524/m.32738 type:complete len:463 (-) Transcript_10524:313-1701(-)